MRIRRFIAKKIHGFIDHDIRFKGDLIFLTGINGSGKTSIINLMVALITPSFDALANVEYEYIKILFEHGGEKINIEANKIDGRVYIRVFGLDSVYEYNKFTLDTDVSPYKEAEYEQEYYRQLAAEAVRHPVIQLISNLPTPMFLGLDRRSRLVEEVRPRYYPSRSIKSGRNIFAGSLARSLLDAASLVETRYRDTLIAVGRLGDALRREILLELLAVEPISGYRSLSAPTHEDTIEIEEMRRDVEALPSVLGLQAREVRSRILPFLNQLQSYANSIPSDYDAKKSIRNSLLGERAMEAILQWSANKPQLKKIQSISILLSKYNENRKKITQDTDKYLKLVNVFLKDSGKRISFDESGYICCTVSGSNLSRPLVALSSGEAQMFVILSHLFFNKMAQEGNVFIIDEPELSLHVQWQELFVESVTTANPQVQFIMATHSPSIILDKTNLCVDLSKKYRIAND